MVVRTARGEVLRRVPEQCGSFQPPGWLEAAQRSDDRELLRAAFPQNDGAIHQQSDDVVGPVAPYGMFSTHVY